MPLGALAGSRDRRDNGPLVVVLVVALASVLLLWVAVRYEWLGMDVGRGGEFCEASHLPIKQPANSLSNLGFVVAGLLVAVRAGRPDGLGPGTMGRRPGFATAYASLVVLLGPASAAMHATGTALGGRLDVASMHLVASFALAYALMRMARRGALFMAVTFAATFAACQLTEWVSTPIPVVMTASNLAFGLVLVAAVLLERHLSRTRLRLDLRWAAAAVGCLALALAIWEPSKTGGPLCDPTSIVQGHAAWHLLGAAAAWCLFRLYASERPSTTP